jgi:formylglycine-generating enzyme required for sulfatase activity
MLLYLGCTQTWPLLAAAYTHMPIVRLSGMAAGALLLSTAAWGNRILVNNVVLTGNTGSAVTVQFDLSWDNSWRGGGAANWDAAWLFVKCHTPTGWVHARLGITNNVAPAGMQLDAGLLTPGTPFNAVSNPAIGFFAYRNAAGAGNLALTGMQLFWDYGAQGYAYNDILQVQVYAIEMVYVPQGTFAMGDGVSTTLVTINTPNATTPPTGTGGFAGSPQGGYQYGAAQNASFPNGFNAYYCMKYELSQQGYVDFLNTLTYTQQGTRTINAPNSASGTAALSNSFRNGIDIQTPGDPAGTPAVYACNLDGDLVFSEATDGTDIPCNFLSKDDVAAYLDWSGLRFFSIYEFEKACRGTVAPTPNDYPWGLGVGTSMYTFASSGTSSEGIATNYSAAGNAAYVATIPTTGNNAGPVRCGIFAANAANTGRVTSGASYYGIMELGGNLGEHAALHPSYLGTHGDGALTPSGMTDLADWPELAAIRGGSFQSSASFMHVSDVSEGGDGDYHRVKNHGARGARTAP